MVTRGAGGVEGGRWGDKNEWEMGRSELMGTRGAGGVEGGRWGDKNEWEMGRSELMGARGAGKVVWGMSMLVLGKIRMLFRELWLLRAPVRTSCLRYWGDLLGITLCTKIHLLH